MSELYIQMLFLIPIIAFAIYVALMGNGETAVEEVTPNGQANSATSSTEADPVGQVAE